VLGRELCDAVGALVGPVLGVPLGSKDGKELRVGSVESKFDGAWLGNSVGIPLGRMNGRFDGPLLDLVLGLNDGRGLRVGGLEPTNDGDADGVELGMLDEGTRLGKSEGSPVLGG